MNKVKSMGMVLVNSRAVIRNADNWSQVTTALHNYFLDNPNEVGGRIEFVNYVARLDNFENDFDVDHTKPKLYLDDLCYSTGDGDEGTYRVDDYNKEFDTEDEVKDFIEELYEDGNIDLDGIKHLDITFIPQEIEGNTFEYAEAGEGGTEIELNSVSRSIADHFGFNFVLAEEARQNVPDNLESKVKEELEKELSRHDLIVMHNPGEMTMEGIDKEIQELQERMFRLQLEKKHREDIKHEL